MPAFEAEVGMPYWIDLTTSDPRKSAHFYEEMLGWEISAESAEEKPYQMARLQGLPIAGLIPQPEEAPMPDTWVTYFLSKDIARDCRRAESLGGRILVEPQQVQLGHMALLADAAGISRSTLHTIEHGGAGVRWEKIPAVAEALGLEMRFVPKES